MINLLDFKTDCTNMIMVKLIRNMGFLDVTNSSSETLHNIPNINSNVTQSELSKAMTHS